MAVESLQNLRDGVFVNFVERRSLQSVGNSMSGTGPTRHRATVIPSARVKHLGTAYQVQMARMTKVQRAAYYEKAAVLDGLLEQDPWVANSRGLLRPLVQLRYMSIIGGSSLLVMLMSLDLASKILQLATVLGSAFA